MQILIVISAIFLGLLFNYNFTGLKFVPAICLFAGIFMVMPTLFNFKLNDFAMVKEHKTILFKNLLVNYFILPIIAISLGLYIGDFGIAGGLFLLSVLAGGGMVMHWIKSSNADTKVGFILLFVNLLLLSLSFYMYKEFSIHFASYFESGSELLDSETGFHVRGAFMLLIVIPFILSRVLLKFFPSIVSLMQNNRAKIGNTSIFIIIFYLFALESSKILFEIETDMFLKAFVATSLFYIASYLVAKVIYNADKPDERAAIWHIITRYITLALILSSLSVNTFGATLILPIMIAYFIQLPLAIYYNKRVLVFR